MNRFWLDVEIEEDAAHWSHAQGKVFVDGEEIEAPAVHIAELARSLIEPGKFSIFTCGCGDALCGHIDQRICLGHRHGITSLRSAIRKALPGRTTGLGIAGTPVSPDLALPGRS